MSFDDLLPQRGRAVLLGELVSSSSERTVCRASIGAEHPYLTDGTVHPLVAVELFAQAAAVHRGLATSRDMARAPVSGRLASILELVVHTAPFPVGTLLLVTVSPGASLGQLHEFSGRLERIEADGSPELAVEGRIAVATLASEARSELEDSR